MIANPRSGPSTLTTFVKLSARIPCGAVNDLAAVMEHPQLVHNGLVATVESPCGPIPTVANPFLVEGERPELGGVPGLGAHTEEVLLSVGYSWEDITALRDHGAI